MNNYLELNSQKDVTINIDECNINECTFILRHVDSWVKIRFQLKIKFHIKSKFCWKCNYWPILWSILTEQQTSVENQMFKKF